MGKHGLPDRWLPYSPMGTVIPGTRFIACKVPLKEALLRSLPENERFGPRDLLEAFPKMGLLVDLTNTTRYYFKQDFTDKDIQYEKIFCPGKVVPPNSIIKQFFDVVDEYLAAYTDPDAVIVVHCTHGVNRTGYFICRYMIERLNISPEDALKNFQMARGHDIERDTYVSDLKNGCKGGNESDLRFVQNSFGRDRRGGQREINYSKNASGAESSRNGVIPRKRHKYDYNEKSEDNYRHNRWCDNKQRPRIFNNYDGQRMSEGERKYSDNWRDHGRSQNPPLLPLPQLPSAHHLTNHPRNLIEPYQDPKPPHQQEPSSVPSFSGPRFTGRGQFTDPPPMGFRGSTRDVIRRPPRGGYRGGSQQAFRGPRWEERRGTSRERFNPLPKFCSPESLNESAASLRLRGNSSSNPGNSLTAPAGNQKSTSGFKLNVGARISSKGEGKGRGRFTQSGSSNCRDEQGPHRNNLSR